MIKKRFIAISGEIVNNRLVFLNTSTGDAITNLDGIHTLEAMDFLHGLAIKHKAKDTVFICYAFKAENEFIFKDLPLTLKNELLQNHTVRRDADELKTAKEDLESIYYDKGVDLDEQECIEYYNRIQEINLSLNKVGKISFNGYDVSLANGKQLTIKRGRLSMVIYDVFGYFRKPLSITIEKYFNFTHPLLTEKKHSHLTVRQMQNSLDCFYISKLANYLYTELAKYGVNLSRFHGASTVTGAVLARVKARKEFRNFNRPKSLSDEAKKAVNSAFYGARTEQLKLGRFENVNVYDLNSAYAKACLFLPKMLQHPVFSRKWVQERFSCWFIEYDLPKNIHYGLLPNRDTSQLTRYKRRGKGYFWQPEIAYLMLHYPNNFEIKYGFYVPYVKADFTDAIAELYELRNALKRAGNPLEKVIKLGLTTVYGKFCQRIGFAYYYNLFYAGFITSYVRANLLHATFGKESKTICFLTDAIHTTANLNIPISDELGEYRHKQYNEGVYLGAGIYKLFNGEETKQATRGFTQLDFIKAYQQMKETGTFTAKQDYFVGHNLHSLAPVEFGEYLKMSQKQIKVAPFDSKVRMYDALRLEAGITHVTSKLLDTFSGRASLEYKPNLNDNYEVIFDAVMAGKF